VIGDTASKARSSVTNDSPGGLGARTTRYGQTETGLLSSEEAGVLFDSIESNTLSRQRGRALI